MAIAPIDTLPISYRSRKPPVVWTDGWMDVEEVLQSQWALRSLGANTDKDRQRWWREGEVCPACRLVEKDTWWDGMYYELILLITTYLARAAKMTVWSVRTKGVAYGHGRQAMCNLVKLRWENNTGMSIHLGISMSEVGWWSTQGYYNYHCRIV